MDYIRSIAKAHYKAAPTEVKDLVEKFFRQLEPDSKGCVSSSKFFSFMKKYPNGDERHSSEYFFGLLDKGKKGVLDFEDVKTLYYILMSRRPFCDSCRGLITGIYYSCGACFNRSRSPFTVCHGCYQNCRLLEVHKAKAKHSGPVTFLDNYTLVQLKRTSTINPQRQEPSHALVRSQSSPGNVARVVATPQRGSSSQSNAIVPAAPRNTDQWSRILGSAANVAVVVLGIGNLAATSCSIL